MDFNTSAELFKALADPSRLKVLKLLASPPANDCAQPGSVCACDLEGELGLSQPTISHHMKLLVRAGLVTATKRGKWTDYTLNPDGFEQARDLLSALEQPGLNAAPCPPNPAKGVPS